MIEKLRHCVGLSITLILPLVLMGCGDKAPKPTIAKLSTAEAVNFRGEPIPNSVKVIAEIRNDGGTTVKLNYGGKARREMSAATDKVFGKGEKKEAVWYLDIEARYQDSEAWRELPIPDLWVVAGGKTPKLYEPKQTDIEAGSSVSLSRTVANPGGLLSTAKPTEIRVFILDPDGKKVVEKTLKL